MRVGDERLDRVVSVVLRAGVILAATLVLIGGITFLASYRKAMPDHRKFHAEPTEFASIRGVLHGALTLDPLFIIQLGLLILIATPVVRVITCAAGFALERDWTYAVVSLIVLAFLIASLVGSGL
ncbi:MAG: DUF1634 domain-containing protein [Bryobacteraceae bacterium]|jgi:uncharacterized membrane protein